MINNISRQVREIDISTTYSLTDPDITLVIANCTSAGFTLTIYNDIYSGAYHRIVVKISDDDSSGNTLTIVDANANFSTTLASTSAAVILEVDANGNWLAAASFPTLDANTAISAADSAGLQASSATSGVTSLTTTVSTNKSTAASATLSGVSAAESIAASATLSGVSGTASTATSQNVSQSLNISTTGSVAGSATLSGVSATASVATSQNVSQSLNVSSAFSLAAS